MILISLQKLPNNVVDLGKIIVATSFEWLPKVQKSSNLVTLLTFNKRSMKDYDSTGQGMWHNWQSS